jgi:hypothetical protein
MFRCRPQQRIGAVEVPVDRPAGDTATKISPCVQNMIKVIADEIGLSLA